MTASWLNSQTLHLGSHEYPIAGSPLEHCVLLALPNCCYCSLKKANGTSKVNCNHTLEYPGIWKFNIKFSFTPQGHRDYNLLPSPTPTSTRYSKQQHSLPRKETDLYSGECTPPSHGNSYGHAYVGGSERNQAQSNLVCQKTFYFLMKKKHGGLGSQSLKLTSLNMTIHFQSINYEYSFHSY